MSAGLLMMFAVSIVIYHVAETDKKTGWIWFGINCCVSMIMGKFFGLTIMMAIWSGLITYLIMFILNLFRPTNFD